MVLFGKPTLSMIFPRSEGGMTLPDQVVYAVAVPGSFLDALASRATHMQPDESGIHARKEIAADDKEE